MNKQEMKLQKVKKSCKTAKSVTNVLSIILTVAVILCLVGALICFCKRADINTALAASGEQITVENIQLNGVLSLKMDVQELKDAGYFAEVFAIECLFGAVVCLICAVIFRQICKLFMTFENSGSPFGEEVLRTLKRTFIAVTVLVTIFVGLGLGLILGLFLWCIYCIMDYGCALQEEVDETVYTCIRKAGHSNMGKIIVRLDRMMADRKISLNELAEQVGITNVNLSKLKTGKVNAVRFSTLEAICRALNCQPGDILEYDPTESKEKQEE